MIQVVAFVVTIGTLLIQGLTLPWLIRTLKIADPKEALKRERETQLAEGIARRATIEAVEAFRDRQTGRTAEARGRHHAAADLSDAADRNRATTATDGQAVMTELAGEMLAARRAAVVKARDERKLDDEVMREVLEHMDFEEAAMNGRVSRDR